MTTESNSEETLAGSLNLIAHILKEQNLRENDMLLSRLAQSRAKAERMRFYSEEEYRQIMNELDAAEAEILRIRSEI